MSSLLHPNAVAYGSPARLRGPFSLLTPPSTTTPFPTRLSGASELSILQGPDDTPPPPAASGSHSRGALARASLSIPLLRRHLAAARAGPAQVVGQLSELGRWGSELPSPGFLTVLLLPSGVTLGKFLSFFLSFSLSIWKLKMMAPVCKAVCAYAD